MNNYKPTIALALLLSLIGCSGQPSTEDTETTAKKNEQVKEQEEQTTPKKPSQWQHVDTQQAAMERVAMDNKKRLSHAKLSPQPMIAMDHYRPIKKNNEKYQKSNINPIQVVTENPVSTFSIDVDSGSYSNMRRMINQGIMPPKDAIRLEELINYFDYKYPTPSNKNQPFALSTEAMIAPWNQDRVLLKIGLKGYELQPHQLGNANLVFLLDVSGSMNHPNKLPLLKKSLSMLTTQLDKHDRVSIVVYAGAAGVVLKPTAGDNRTSINNALNKLNAGGSTHGSQGIELAYQLAQENMINDGVNRVILATDGDFNVGTTNIDALKDLIENKRKLGIGLTTLGFGQGNYNDHLMEQLADVGNGNYAYIDNINEARKVLVDQLSSTLQIIAKDVKIQVEFNPQKVAEYRLIGYENRQLKREDFNNDKVDAGDIGAGHDVTAIYELTMANAKNKSIDPLHYQKTNSSNSSTDLALIKLRYKQPNSDKSQLITHAITPDLINRSISQDFKFSTSVAAFGQLIKGGKYMENYNYQDIIKLANDAKGQDEYGYRSEFIQLVRTVSTLPVNQPKVVKQQELRTSTN